VVLKLPNPKNSDIEIDYENEIANIPKLKFEQEFEISLVGGYDIYDVESMEVMNSFGYVYLIFDMLEHRVKFDKKNKNKNE
jgi:hypothetical protein